MKSHGSWQHVLAPKSGPSLVTCSLKAWVEMCGLPFTWAWCGDLFQEYDIEIKFGEFHPSNTETLGTLQMVLDPILLRHELKGVVCLSYGAGLQRRH